MLNLEARSLRIGLFLIINRQPSDYYDTTLTVSIMWSARPPWRVFPDFVAFFDFAPVTPTYYSPIDYFRLRFNRVNHGSPIRFFRGEGG